MQLVEMSKNIQTEAISRKQIPCSWRVNCNCSLHTMSRSIGNYRALTGVILIWFFTFFSKNCTLPRVSLFSIRSAAGADRTALMCATAAAVAAITAANPGPLLGPFRIVIEILYFFLNAEIISQFFIGNLYQFWNINFIYFSRSNIINF